MSKKVIVLLNILLVTGCATSPINIKPPAAIIAKGTPFVEANYDDTVTIKPPAYIFPVSPRISLIVDLDFDGVNDETDQCLNTPPNTKVDAKGCPLPLDVDSDKDGVFDNKDKCPNTPPNTKVYANGCPLDSDGDGVPDYKDKCANTPAKVKVDNNGCPYPPPKTTTNKGTGGTGNWKGSGGTNTYSGGSSSQPINVNVVNNNYINGVKINDQDQDGVNDEQDKCTNTPVNTTVDKKGCPVPQKAVAAASDDNDKDGVKNALDNCPNSAIGAKVDAQGCAKDDEVLTSLNVLFATNKANIVESAYVDILRVADFMRAHPDVVVTIEGHTDDRASIIYNQKLSERRAHAVRQELIRFGVNANKLLAIGYGELKPIADNSTEFGRAQNRRVIATAKMP